MKYNKMALLSALSRRFENKAFQKYATMQFSESNDVTRKEGKISKLVGQEIFNEYFKYDTSSASYLRWKKKTAETANVKVNDIAGWITEHNYWNVQFFDKSYSVHRIIYEIHFGKIPEDYFIDHIDGNKQNNSLENLRVVTRSVNNRNQGMYKNNNTGMTGVSYWEDKLGRGGYRATVHLCEGGKKTKYFSCLKHGKTTALLLATRWRKSMIDELNFLGAGYTDRHGLAEKEDEPKIITRKSSLNT